MYIYIHIPFCTSICSYCDFPKVLYDKKYIRNYLDSLKEEIITRYQGEEVLTIYIGGGTPTSLDLEELEYLMEITKLFQKEEKIEFTVESNIESLTLEKIKLLKQYGVNRISLGVQSFQQDTLKELNRHHTKEDVFEVVEQLKKHNIKNISIDYIYGINSDLEKIKQDIKCFLQLDIPHISCYSLIIEESTLFGIQKRDYIKEEVEEKMYQEIRKTLTNHHYIQYEISNYSKPGYESLHNLNYWNNEEYYGFGLGAVSYLNHTRISNTKSLTKYLEKEYILTKDYEDEQIRISNTFMLGFRKIKGIDITLFKKEYQKEITEIEPVKELLQQNILKLVDNHLKVNPDYLYLSNEIILKFL